MCLYKPGIWSQGKTGLSCFLLRTEHQLGGLILNVKGMGRVGNEFFSYTVHFLLKISKSK